MCSRASLTHRPLVFADERDHRLHVGGTSMSAYKRFAHPSGALCATHFNTSAARSKLIHHRHEYSRETKMRIDDDQISITTAYWLTVPAPCSQACRPLLLCHSVLPLPPPTQSLLCALCLARRSSRWLVLDRDAARRYRALRRVMRKVAGRSQSLCSFLSV